MALGEGKNFFSREKAETSASVYFLPRARRSLVQRRKPFSRKARYFAEGLLAAVCFGSGKDLPLGYARQLDGNGGVRVAWVWRLHKTYKTYKTYKMMMGAPLYTPRVCRAQCFLARAKERPLGNATRRVTAG